MKLSIEEYLALQRDRDLLLLKNEKLRANPPAGSLPKLAEELLDGLASLTPSQRDLLRAVVKDFTG